MPVEKLKFEHEKRQRNIPILEARSSGVERELGELIGSDSYSTEVFNARFRTLASGRDGFDAEVDNLKVEMDAIEKAMESKWT
jgi:hypothetical protein